MNQTVIDKKDKIGTACELCFYQLAAYNREVEAFQTKRREIAALPYVEAEKEARINKALDALKEAGQVRYNEIKRNLDTIKINAVALEDILDIGEELKNAVSVVKALGASMPSETRFNLVNPFRGQRQSLLILQAAYKEAGIDPLPYFKGLVLDASDRVDTLDSAAYQLAIQPSGTMLTAANFGEGLEDFADDLGVPLKKRFRDVVDTTSTYAERLRAVAGLGAAD